MTVEYQKMNPALKGLWLEALRSGEYEQGVGGLHRPKMEPGGRDTYCCLGVLSEIACAQGVMVKQPGFGGGYGYRLKSSVGASWATIMPDPEMERAFGLDTRVANTLAGMNDGDSTTDDDGNEIDVPGQTFAEIADWIEEHL